EEGKYGNHWSDLEGRKTYPIDGPAEAEDIYPLELTYNESSTLSIAVIVISFFVLSYFLRKMKRRN
ncbi:MAG: hypothetical protein KAR08_04685, partial [Candidatus Heimdallarchaeota archaeon]|nr:hypothetical protein [Candidatus Heimdallarchaeota archaeon]